MTPAVVSVVVSGDRRDCSEPMLFSMILLCDAANWYAAFVDGRLAI